jgi:hypothetical protein
VRPDQIEKELHFGIPYLLGGMMPDPLFRDDFVSQDSGFVPREGSQTCPRFRLFIPA